MDDTRQQHRDRFAGAAGRETEFHRLPDRETVSRVPAQKVLVVEEVGAGDAFAGGYLAALIAGIPAPARLGRGHELAAWVLGAPGDHRPLEKPRAG